MDQSSESRETRSRCAGGRASVVARGRRARWTEPRGGRGRTRRSFAWMAGVVACMTYAGTHTDVNYGIDRLPATGARLPALARLTASGSRRPACGRRLGDRLPGAEQATAHGWPTTGSCQPSQAGSWTPASGSRAMYSALRTFISTARNRQACVFERRRSWSCSP
jgi:hypothetical protein